MWEFLESHFAGRFMPHGHCYLWTPSMVWTQVSANALIGLAYFSISATLAILVRRVRLPFSWVYIAFGVFILACGLTHFLDVATVWHPIYWADAAVRVVTAVASVGTALLLVPLVPKVLSLAQLASVARDRGERLEVAVADLSTALEETTRYRLLVDSVKDATYMLDAEGHMSSWNGGAESITGYSSREVSGRHVSVLFPPDDVAAGHLERSLAAARREGFVEEEAWLVRKDGTRFRANVSLTAMRDSAGTLVGFAKVVRDLTERGRAEEAMRALVAENAMLAERSRVQEFQERFLAILGHDLRNPLAAIEMGTTLLMERRDNDEAATRVLARMEASSARMSRMIEQILDLTRTRLAGGLEVHPTRADLKSLLEDTVDEVRAAHPERALEVRCDSLPGFWDKDRLAQVFSNLVSNAVQHGSASQPVTVEARGEHETLTVTVHNGGPPIPPALLGQLFDPFRRGDRDSRTPRTAGLGLGLFISRQIARAHGGDIDVDSSDGGGTTFRVTLPLLPTKSNAGNDRS